MEEQPAFRQDSPSADARLDALLTAAMADEASRVTPAPDALARLNARLDTRNAARPWWVGGLKIAGALAAALLLLMLVTPVGRLAAAGLHSASQAVVTTLATVRDFATGRDDSTASPTPKPPDTATATTVGGSAVATAPTGSSTRPPGAAPSGPATRTGTIPAVATSNSPPAQGARTATPRDTPTPTRPPAPTATPAATATTTPTPPPTASAAKPTSAASATPVAGSGAHEKKQKTEEEGPQDAAHGPRSGSKPRNPVDTVKRGNRPSGD